MGEYWRVIVDAREETGGCWRMLGESTGGF